MRRLKIGMRTPSFKKRVAAWKSGLPGGKRFWRHRVGAKMPRNMGWVTNPNKFVYQKIYRRTTFSAVPRLRRSRSGGSSVGTLILILIALSVVVTVVKAILILAAVIAAVVSLGLGALLLTAFLFPRSRQPILRAKERLMNGSHTPSKPAG